MIRREFITLLGSGAVAWPLAARAQQPKIASVGVLITVNPESPTTRLRDALRELGYVEGKNIRFEFRSADGKSDVLRGLADELVRLRVDVLVAVNTPAVLAAKQATTVIPIVMARVADPIRTGLVSNLAHPEGNVTGFSAVTSEMATKMLELVREVLPSTKRVGVLANDSAADPFSSLFVEEIEAGGQAIGVAIQSTKVRGSDQIEAAIADNDKGRVDAVIVQPILPFQPAIDLMKKYRLPSISPTPFFARAGGLISYAPDLNESYVRIAVFIDKILKGAKPSELPVEQPTRYELVINLKTAKAIGLTIPPTLLTRADEVIE